MNGGEKVDPNWVSNAESTSTLTIRGRKIQGVAGIAMRRKLVVRISAIIGTTLTCLASVGSGLSVVG